MGVGGAGPLPRAPRSVIKEIESRDARLEEKSKRKAGSGTGYAAEERGYSWDEMQEALRNTHCYLNGNKVVSHATGRAAANGRITYLNGEITVDMSRFTSLIDINNFREAQNFIRRYRFHGIPHTVKTDAASIRATRNLSTEMSELAEYLQGHTK